MSPDHPLLGHGTVVGRLAAAADGEALSHAILLTGAEAVGKTTAALALAALLLDAGSWPGGLFAHPDLWIEDSETENLSIERVRPGGRDGPTLQDFLALRPYAGGRRVGVIGRADRLTEQAANCLLKTIEEPPPRTHLLLCAAHAEKLPATVISRCETVALAPVATPAISHWLRDVHGVDAETAELAAPLASGRPGRALRLATEPGALDAELDALDVFLSAGGGGAAAALRAAGALAFPPGAEGRERAMVTLGAWASFVRDACCYATGAPELAVWTGLRPALERWAEDLPAERTVAILDRLMGAAEAVAAYAQPRLAFETLMLDIFGGSDTPPAVERATRPARAAALGAAAGRRPRSVSGGAAPSGKQRRSPAARRARSKAGG